MTREEAIKEIERLEEEKQEFIEMRKEAFEKLGHLSADYRYAQRAIREYNQSINNIRESYISEN